MTLDTSPCPCGRVATPPSARKAHPLAYADCCGRYIDHWADAPAPDAESLMRSRYTAFVRERADYLRATWHASTRPATLDFDAGARWLGLDVRDHRSYRARAVPRSSLSRATAWAGALCACTSAAASCAKPGAGTTSMATSGSKI
jgi:uncharacterized protein YchJ